MGRVVDPETALIYLRNRYYDPTIAQYLTRDPADPITRSAYGYVSGNPLNGSDPSGLSKCGQFSLGGLVDCAATASHDPVGTFTQGWNGMSTGAKIADVALAALPASILCALGPCEAAAAWFGSTAAGSYLLSNCENETGAIGAGGGYVPAGSAADFSLDELAQFAYSHAGAGDFPNTPTVDEILRTLENGRVTQVVGQNSVRVDLGAVRVIINEDLPVRSTAYYPGRS